MTCNRVRVGVCFTPRTTPYSLSIPHNNCVSIFDLQSKQVFNNIGMCDSLSSCPVLCINYMYIVLRVTMGAKSSLSSPPPKFFGDPSSNKQCPLKRCVIPLNLLKYSPTTSPPPKYLLQKSCHRCLNIPLVCVYSICFNIFSILVD